MEIKEQEKDGKITIWTKVSEYACSLGVRFTRGDRLQLYTHALVTTNWDIFTSQAGMAIADWYHNELLNYAEEHYPREFARMPAPIPRND